MLNLLCVKKKKCKSDPRGSGRHTTSRYYVFIGGNLISWKSKKQDVVGKFSVKVEYRAMALATFALIWLKHLLQELRFRNPFSMRGPSTLKWIATLSEKILHQNT